jgi:hypothetical protein
MKTLTFEQMESINAGWPEWIVNAWNAIRDFCRNIWEWVCNAWYVISNDGVDWVKNHITIDPRNGMIEYHGVF